MKKFFDSPSVEIEKFTVENQITTSINEGGETVDPWGIQTMNELEY